MLSGQAPAKSLHCEAKNTSGKMSDFRPLLIICLELGQQSRFQANQLRWFTVECAVHQPETKLFVKLGGCFFSSSQLNLQFSNMLTKSQVISLPKNV